MGASPTHTTLRLGSKGAEVTILQTQLNALQLYEMPIDDTFSDRTFRAVKKYQASQGLPDTGVCAQLTWKALDKTQATSAVAAAKRDARRPNPGVDSPLIPFVLAKGPDDEQARESIQVEKGKTVVLSWVVSGPYDSLVLEGGADETGKLDRTGKLEVQADEDRTYTLTARNALGWDAKTVHVAVHEAGEVVSDHATVGLKVPLSGSLWKGPLIPKKWGELKYFELELELDITAEGELIVGENVGEEDPEGGLGVDVTVAGYDGGKLTQGIGLKVDKQFGKFDIKLEEISAKGALSSEGAEFSISAELSAYGTGIEVSLILLEIEKNWKVKALQVELEISVKPFEVSIPLGRNVKIESLTVQPHITGTAKPNWTRIAEYIAEKIGKKVLVKALENAATKALTTSAEAAEGAEATEAGEALTEEAVEGAEAAGEAAEGEEVGLLISLDMLVIAAGALAAIWIMVEAFAAMEQGEWNREAAKKVDELTYIYMEGLRKALFLEPEPDDEKEKIGYKGGANKRLALVGKYYRYYRDNQPALSKAQVDKEIDAEIRATWVDAHERSNWKIQMEIDAWELCKRTAKVSIWSAWAKDGRNSSDRKWAFTAVFGKTPGTSEVLEEWEREAWDKFQD